MLKYSISASLSILVCCTYISASASECIPLPSSFDYKPYGQEATLNVSEIATTPNNTVLLGGSYNDAANIIHPVLLLSSNAGKDWNDKSLSFPGHGIGAIETYGLDHIWLLINFQQEGQNFPKYLITSTDAGKSWCKHSLDFIKFADTQLSSVGIKFYNRSNGLLWLEASAGSHSIYYTNNGGKHWKPLFKGQREKKLEIDSQFEYPDSKTLPLHGPLWTKDMDFYKITGLIRLIKTEEQYSIQGFNYSDGNGWTDISSIRINRLVSGNKIQ